MTAPIPPPAIECPSCHSPAPAGARFCPQCGGQVIAEMEADAKVLYRMVLKTTGRTIPSLLAKPKRCPGCNQKAEAVATVAACMKTAYVRSEPGPPKRAYWKITDYDGWRCVACGFEYLVGPGPEKVDWEEQEGLQPDDRVWKQDRPLVRFHRGDCGLCKEFEAVGTCVNCRRAACSSEFVEKYNLCVQCAPRCNCGRVALYSCRRCKKMLCREHQKRWFFTYCAECKQVQLGRWGLRK